MSTLFSKIIRGEIPCYKVAEDDNYFAFLDINPLHEGHTLVIPKEETDYVFDLSDTRLAGLIIFSKRVALAIQEAIPCKRIGVAILGLEVPHAHIHLVPMDTMEDVNFRNPKMKFTAAEFKNTAESIKLKLK